MSEQKPAYYQFQKEMQYQVFARFEDTGLESEMIQTMEALGFSKVDDDKLKEIEFSRSETRILKISKASIKVSQQIRGISNGMDKYGPESISSQGGYEVYRYHGVGMMIFAQQSNTWEMGLVNPTLNIEKIKVMLTRFVSWALAPKGVVGFWAVPVDQGFVVMKPKESLFEAVFIDIDQMAMMTQDGIKPICADLQILRVDETLKNSSKSMSKEALLSFLCSNTTHFSYSGLPNTMRAKLYEVASFASGMVYPVDNYRPRTSHQEIS
ncbi:MAG: hypothetical protein KC478_00765 [Bacteriovoracaceae bacterium]|nr:hypothetical protein [Bacteriovoracaceae bacterium]